MHNVFIYKSADNFRIHLSWFVKLSAKVIPLDFALNSGISRRQTSWLVASWIVRVNSLEPWYFMPHVILWNVLDAIDKDPGGYVSYRVLKYAVELHVVEAVWKVKSELMCEKWNNVKSELFQQKRSRHKPRGVFRHINTNFWTIWYSLHGCTVHQ